MKRRDVLAAMLAAAAPAALARAAGRVRRIATLTPVPYADRLAAEMRTLGWAEADFRVEPTVLPLGTEGIDREAARIVATRPDVIVSWRSNYVGALARATRTIPIVSGGIADPVAEGVARTLRSPGGNVTGLSNALPEAAALQLGTLRALVPDLQRVVFVSADVSRRGMLPPAHVRGCKALDLACDFIQAETPAAFESLVSNVRPSAREALWVGDLPKGLAAKQVADAATQRGIVTIGQSLAYVDQGVLFAIWLLHSQFEGRTAAIVSRVLKGEDPAGIPFELPDYNAFRFNRTTARRLGLRIPAELLLRITDPVG